MNPKMNSHDMYWWIFEHPELNKHEPCGSVVIEITPHMVCPDTKRIEELVFLNTKLEFWVELMMPFMDEFDGKSFSSHMHDWELDCGGDTWHDAVENLYNKVIEKYGDYDNSPKEPTQEQLDDIEEFMSSMTVIKPNTKELSAFEVELMYDRIKQYRETIAVLEKHKQMKYADKQKLQGYIDDLNGRIKDIKRDINEQM